MENAVLRPGFHRTIVADRPFLWAIIHQNTKAILFIGRLTDPTASNPIE